MALSITNSHAETPISSSALGSMYIGAFGGGGGMMSTKLTQEGTAFYSESEGGPLAVNAMGSSSSSSAWFVGGHIGYAWPAELLSRNGSAWQFMPALELEGFYLGGNTVTGNNLVNETDRLAQHDFTVTYPLSMGVFLVSGVLNIDNLRFKSVHPYVGIGAGTAVTSISNAVSTQTTPAEVGINHYNSDPNDTANAFAVQPKLGLRFDINKKLSAFAEYRFLYVSETNYAFGSTVYPTHVPTSSWSVKMGGQCYNLGAVGLQYIL